jgi:hypothetical protein
VNERVHQPVLDQPEGAAAPSVVDAGHQLLGLQRKAGNATVNRLIQTKLTVGRADDPYEREADRVAGEVMRRLRAGDVSGGATPAVQMKSADPLGGTPVPADLEQRISSSSGRALDGVTRSSMEGAFGADFSGVRVHTGPEAATLSESLQAHAFTTGSDIFFGKGADPSSSPELLAHELTHVVQQSGGTQRKIRRFVDVKTFAARTDEGMFTGKSTAQKEIEKKLAAYAALGAANDKGKIVIPDKKLKQAMDLILSMKAAAEAWLGAHTLDDGSGGTTVDPKRINRAAGMSWFFMAADAELASLENRLNTSAKDAEQDEVVADTSGRLALKEHYQGNLSGSLTKLGNLIDKVAPNDGDSTELSIDLKIPVQPGVFVGGTLDVEVSKDDGKVEAGLEAAFQAGGEVGVANLAGALGGYFKAGAKTGVDVMRLVSYGFYRKFRESNAIPAEISSLIWGGGTSEFAKKKADKWSLQQETDLLGEGSENYVELGGLASLGAEVDLGVAELEAEAKYTSGKRYDAESLKNRKGGAGQENKGSDSFFTKNVANKFGRGAEKSTGRSTNNLDLSFGASVLGGAFSGELGASFSWRDKGLTAIERAKPGAVVSELEEMSFSLALGGSVPADSLAAKLVDLAADVAKYAKKQVNTAANAAAKQDGVPTSELMLAKSYAQLCYDAAAGVPMFKWVEDSTAEAAESGSESLLDSIDSKGSVGLEVEITVEKGDGGMEGSIELKYVKSKSVELPEILEVELVRKSRIGKATYAGGAWT